MWRLFRGPTFVVLAVVVWGCGSPRSSDPAVVTTRLEIDLDRSNPERLLRYYFGGYAAPEGDDPFVRGLLSREEGRYFLDLDALAALHPGLEVTVKEAAGDDRLEWEELAAFLHATYYAVRTLPPTLDALRAEVPYQDSEDPWFHVELDGVMSTARRHVSVSTEALRAALKGYQQQGEHLLYPAGTAVVGEAHLDGQHVETNVMRKRSDGFWDFFTYGPDGALADRTQALPRALKSPTQCVGCHFGAKLFEPERSFPATAPPGPHGPRAIYVDEQLRDPEVVRFFDEHRKRSDTLLGIYNTLFVAQLRADRRAGRISEEDAQLLDNLGL